MRVLAVALGGYLAYVLGHSRGYDLGYARGHTAALSVVIRTVRKSEGRATI